jgi:hypothetical protein
MRDDDEKPDRRNTKLVGNPNRPVHVGRVDDFPDPSAAPSVLDAVIAREEAQLAGEEMPEARMPEVNQHEAVSRPAPAASHRCDTDMGDEDEGMIAGKYRHRLRKTMGGKDVRDAELRRELHLNGHSANTHHSR